MFRANSTRSRSNPPQISGLIPHHQQKITIRLCDSVPPRVWLFLTQDRIIRISTGHCSSCQRIASEESICVRCEAVKKPPPDKTRTEFPGDVMSEVPARRCSKCGHNGHNSRTCISMQQNSAREGGLSQSGISGPGPPQSEQPLERDEEHDSDFSGNTRDSRRKGEVQLDIFVHGRIVASQTESKGGRDFTQNRSSAVLDGSWEWSHVLSCDLEVLEALRTSFGC